MRVTDIPTGVTCLEQRVGLYSPWQC